MAVLTEQQGEARRYTLCPNRSLDWRSTKRVFLGFVACMGLFSAYWVAQGAWLVLPFFGLELLVLGLGLYLSALAGSRREVVEIDGAELRVLRGGRRLERVEHLPRYWSRVVLSTDPAGWCPSRLCLVAHGRRVQVGAALVEPERLALAAELTRQLGLDTAIFHRRPEPVVTGAAAPAPQVQRREGTWP
ncbi:MAG: DUF2244 domain-containing protein [Bdellovibrio bacteriovorus]